MKHARNAHGFTTVPSIVTAEFVPEGVNTTKPLSLANGAIAKVIPEVAEPKIATTPSSMSFSVF